MISNSNYNINNTRYSGPLDSTHPYNSNSIELYRKEPRERINPPFSEHTPRMYQNSNNYNGTPRNHYLSNANYNNLDEQQQRYLKSYPNRGVPPNEYQARMTPNSTQYASSGSGGKYNKMFNQYREEYYNSHSLSNEQKAHIERIRKERRLYDNYDPNIPMRQVQRVDDGCCNCTVM